eukprot:SAG31_NODE_694_length_12769_cov_8.102447_17_plen_240_part_00
MRKREGQLSFAASGAGAPELPVIPRVTGAPESPVVLGPPNCQKFETCTPEECQGKGLLRPRPPRRTRGCKARLCTLGRGASRRRMRRRSNSSVPQKRAPCSGVSPRTITIRNGARRSLRIGSNARPLSRQLKLQRNRQRWQQNSSDTLLLADYIVFLCPALDTGKQYKKKEVLRCYWLVSLQSGKTGAVHVWKPGMICMRVKERTDLGNLVGLALCKSGITVLRSSQLRCWSLCIGAGI